MAGNETSCHKRPSSSCNSEFKRRSKRMRIFEDTEENENPERSFPDNFVIPDETNLWDRNLLHTLRVYLNQDELDEPSEIIDVLLESLPSLASKRQHSVESIKKRASLILECFKEFDPFQRLDFDDVLQIKDKENSKYPLFIRDGSGCYKWTTEIPDNPVKGEEHWYHMFQTHKDLFAEDLKYMIMLDHHYKGISKSMYGVLFKDFLGMFGLHCVMEPSVPIQAMDIGGTEVSSTPNMLLLERLNVHTNTPGAYDMDVLSVIKVTDDGDSEMEPDLRVLSSSLSSHVGDLLLHCPSSACKNHGVMGIILDKTYVTFTYLYCNEKQFTTLESGKRNLPGYCPKVILSSSYNILKARDRSKIVETLIILGLLQRL